MKTCKNCGKKKPLLDFREYKNNKFRNECKKCEVKHNLMKRQAHKLAGTKPLTCQCCGKESTSLVVDHCHKSGEFRGWLCINCNTGIGKLGDNLLGVTQAMNYLLLVTNK